MARAFIASVPLAIVLVAALVVPVTVIPGTFGFESWPSSPGERVTERQVRLEPPRVAAVPVRPSRAPEGKRSLASVTTQPPAVRAATRAPSVVRPAPAAHHSAPVTRHTSGPTHPTPAPTGRPTPQPSTPAQPQHQPQQPSSEPEPSPGLVAGGEPPVARQDPTAPQAAPPPAAPVEDVPAPPPVRHIVHAFVPCEGNHGHGEHGHGHGGDDED